MSLMIDEYNSFNDITSIQEQWDDLVEANGQDIFMTFDWCKVWWKYYGKGRKLRVYAFRDSDELVGILPLFEESIRLGVMKIKVLKIVGSDYTLSQFILPLNKSYIDKITSSFSDAVSGYAWDVICLGPCSGLYEGMDQVFDSLSNCFKNISTKVFFNQTIFEVDDNLEKYVSCLSKSERKDYRYAYNYLSKENLVLESYEVQSDIEAAMKSFTAMHTKQWHQRNRAGHFGDWPLSEEFHIDQACGQFENDRLRLLLLKIDDETVSYKYGYQVGDKLFAILTTSEDNERMPKVGLGRLSFYEQLKLCYKYKIKVIDSMRGVYPHKSRLGGKIKEIKSITIISDTFCSKMKYKYLRTVADFYNKLYYKLLYCRIFPKLKLSKRARLSKFWIRTNMFS